MQFGIYFVRIIRLNIFILIETCTCSFTSVLKEPNLKTINQLLLVIVFVENWLSNVLDGPAGFARLACSTFLHHVFWMFSANFFNLSKRCSRVLAWVYMLAMQVTCRFWWKEWALLRRARLPLVIQTCFVCVLTIVTFILYQRCDLYIDLEFTR
jgi:hypothetical protein